MNVRGFIKTIFGANGKTCEKESGPCLHEAEELSDVERKKQALEESSEKLRAKGHELRNEVAKASAIVRNKIRELDLAEETLQLNQERNRRR